MMNRIILPTIESNSDHEDAGNIVLCANVKKYAQQKGYIAPEPANNKLNEQKEEFATNQVYLGYHHLSSWNIFIFFTF